MFQSFDDSSLQQNEYYQQDSPPECNYQSDYEHWQPEKSMIKCQYDMHPNINSPQTLHEEIVLNQFYLNSMQNENLEEENQSPSSQDLYHFFNDAYIQRHIAFIDSSQILVEGQQKNAHEQERLFIDTNSTYHIKDEYSQSLYQAQKEKNSQKVSGFANYVDKDVPIKVLQLIIQKSFTLILKSLTNFCLIFMTKYLTLVSNKKSKREQNNKKI